MSAIKQDLTPEEKLLALIQQQKPQERAPATVAAMAESEASANGGGTAARRADAPESQTVTAPASSRLDPQPEKKLRLAAEPATLVAQPLKPSSPDQSTAAPVAIEPAPSSSIVADAHLGDKPADRMEPKRAAAIPGPAGQATPVRIPSAMTRLGGVALTNRILLLVVLVLLVAVVYSVASIRSDVTDEIGRQIASAGTLPLPPLTVTRQTPPPLDLFLAKAAERDIFRPVRSSAATNGPVKVVGQVADLKLVGISLDAAAPEESEAIIRTKTDSKTHFVKLGQGVGDTGLTLVRVLPDRVILRANKQEYELK